MTTTTTLPDVSIPTPGGWRALPPRVAARALPELTVVDVREPDEFGGPLGHVPGARLVPLRTLPGALQGVDKDAPLLVLCRSGGRSTAACGLLRSAGFRQIYELTGGMMAWRESGLPVER